MFITRKKKQPSRSMCAQHKKKMFKIESIKWNDADDVSSRTREMKDRAVVVVVMALAVAESGITRWLILLILLCKEWSYSRETKPEIM